MFCFSYLYVTKQNIAGPLHCLNLKVKPFRAVLSIDIAVSVVRLLKYSMTMSIDNKTPNNLIPLDCLTLIGSPFMNKNLSFVS